MSSHCDFLILISDLHRYENYFDKFHICLVIVLIFFLQV